jgi:outer membrane protein TolC
MKARNLDVKFSRSLMRHLILSLAIVCCLFVFDVAAAQETSRPLTLDDCVRLALVAPSSVRLARQRSEIARYGKNQAVASFLPRAQVNNLFIYNSPSLTNPDLFSFVALNGIREYSSLFTVTEELDTSGRLRAALARSQADRDAAAANLALTERDLKRAVAGSYYQLLLARRVVQVARDTLEEARSFEARTKRLFQSGEAAQADVVKASAQVAFLDQASSSAELMAQIANQELASFWTTDVSTRLLLADIFDQIPPASAESPASSSPFLKRVEFNLLDAEHRGFLADSRQARAALLPQASVVFQYGVDALRLNAQDRGYAAFVNLNIPVFDWFKNRDASRQFGLQAQQVETSRLIAERTFSKEYENARARVKTVHTQLTTAESQVKLSEENLRLSRVRYEGGEGSALDVVTAQTQLAQARTNHYSTVAHYFTALADLDVASGR